MRMVFPWKCVNDEDHDDDVDDDVDDDDDNDDNGVGVDVDDKQLQHRILL
jgi:hypothetical protein